MPKQVDLYDNSYAKVDYDLYRDIRTDTYGQDLGQTSWVTSAESDLIPALLNLSSESRVLEVGCGSGMYAMYVANRTACQITGVDVNTHAIEKANQLAVASALDGLVHFQQCDASDRLPFADSNFDGAFSNDAVCHIAGRLALFKELFRVLRPGARLVFSDALLIGGLISQSELATRSSIGPYFFSPPGENDRLLAAAGFNLLSVEDTSEQAAAIAHRWHSARARRREQLTTLEGPERYEGLQLFLACVHELTSERRLLRYLYLAEKPRGSSSA